MHTTLKLKEEWDLYLSDHQESDDKENQTLNKIQKTKALEGQQILLVDDDIRNVYAL